jgi:MFS family permease
VAGAFSLFTLVHGLASFPLGWLADRIGTRRLVLAGALLLATGLLLDSAVTRPWHLFLAFGLVTSLGVAGSGWVPAVIMIQRWFPERVGTVLGLTSAGIGVGIVLFPPFCQFLIELAGWRVAFRVVAAVAAAWMVPATLFLVKDAPRLVPAAAAREAGRGAGEVTLADAVVTARFWLLSAAQLTASFVNQMLLAHQVAYLVDHGLPALRAASVVAVVGVGSIVAKAGGGWASDLFGREAMYSLGMACVIASIGSLGALSLTHGVAWAFLYGALVGVGYAITAPLMPAVISDLYRGRHFGAILGAIHVSNAIGGSGGPWVAGRLYDVTGSYAIPLVMGVVAAGVSMVALWLGGPRRAGAR